jgi:glycogen debranching enzyme
MRARIPRLFVLPLSLALALPPVLGAQGVPKFEVARSPIQLEGPSRLGIYLGGVGREAAFFGSETGELEAWAWPVKLLHDFELGFKIPDYSEPIPGYRVAKRVIVRPELMTVVYSHATFTVMQHFLVPLHEPGIIVLLNISTVRPLEIVASFQADLDLMWPAGIGGQYAFYDSDNRRFILSESRREYNAYVGSPFATEASTHPAHATPDAPSLFRIAVDRERIKNEFVPIVIAGGIMPRDSVDALYERLLTNARSYYDERVDHARFLREQLASVQMPDTVVNLAFEWAKVNLDEALVCNPDLGCGLVAGYGPSGRGRRPGFGWFFGGDASINTLGIVAVGHYELARHALAFQARYQRDDGKMPHEVTQSALRTREDWFTEFPYAYYHADTTPYWIVALHRYWLASADTAFVREHRAALVSAYRWCLEHDSDGDRIVDNTAGGLGAIEVGGLSEGMHQDIYLAAVSVEGLRGMADLAAALGDGQLAAEARRHFETAKADFERQYYMEDVGRYAFGILEGGKTNPAITAWPAVAGAFQLLDPDRAGPTLDALASPALMTDWGVRLLSSDHPQYDPLHYNNGAVWPFMTGFTSWALFNYGREEAAYRALRANAESTFFGALGRNPELMSGAYHQTLDTTVPHQFFATSMIPTPLILGLLRARPDLARHQLKPARR